MSVEIISEIGNSHGGSLDRAHRLIDAAKAAGVDACKWQCYLPSELVALRGDGPAPEPWGSTGWTMRDLYEKAQTPHAWFPELVAHCNDVGMPWFSSVFGPESLALLESLWCPRYKLAALDLHAVDWRQKVVSTGKPVIRSVGEWDFRGWAGPNVSTLWCPPGYPQPGPQLHCLWADEPRFDGFSYHGTDPRVPVAAVAAGARIVEFHFHLRDEPNEMEAPCCLDQYQTAWMVKEIRDVEAWL